MTYSSYLDRCREQIEHAQEYDSDKFLVALIRIQQLLGRAAELIPYGDDEASRRINYAPVHMALTAIHKELDVLIRDQPPEVECNGMWSCNKSLILSRPIANSAISSLLDTLSWHNLPSL